MQTIFLFKQLRPDISPSKIIKFRKNPGFDLNTNNSLLTELLNKAIIFVRNIYNADWISILIYHKNFYLMPNRWSTSDE